MKISILGATGLVGRELLPLIDRAWPGATLHLYASRARSVELAGARREVMAATALLEKDAPRGQLAFVALDDEHSARYVPRLLELGHRVVDKSNTYRLDPAVPLVVAGVNCARVTGEAQLVANPNCTTIPLTTAIAPLRRRFGLRSLTVATYQAISGAGIADLDQFLKMSREGYSSPGRLGLCFDPGGYAGNVVPHAGKTDDSGFSGEERKLVAEGQKILEDDAVAISAQCCRVPVAVGHYLQVWLTLGEPASPAAVEGALADAAFVRLSPGPAGAGLSARHCVEHRDEVLVGRIRGDGRDASGRSLCLTAVADNLRLGAATNAVRIASRWFSPADPALRAPGLGV